MVGVGGGDQRVEDGGVEGRRAVVVGGVALDEVAGPDGVDPFNDDEADVTGKPRSGFGGVTEMAICMGTTPPEEVGSEELLDDEVGLDLFLGSLVLAISSLSCPLSPPRSSHCSQTQGTKSLSTRKSDSSRLYQNS